MKRKLIFALTLCSVLSFSQTKSETEEWIVQKYNEYERPNNEMMDLWIEDGYLYHYWSVDKSSPEKRIALIFKIKIQDIVGVKTTTKKLNAPEVISLFTIYTKKKGGINKITS